MKILFIIDSLRLGGKERRLVELLKSLKENRKIKCQLILLSDQIFYSEILSLNIETHLLTRKFRFDPFIFLSIYKICKNFRPDIVHSWESMCSVYTAPIARILGIKFINGMIANAPVKLKFLSKSYVRSKITFPLSHAIISNSYAGLKAYKVPKRKSVCIQNGFNFARLEKCESVEKTKEQLGIQDEKVVGMVARFESHKDYKTFIKSAQIILRKRKDVIFLAIGDGKNLLSSKKFAESLDPLKFKFLGKRNDIESMVNIFDIGVLSTFTEGISNSIMEYMAMGKPVVATDNDGSRELVEDKKTGFLVEAGNEKELSKKIEYLLNNTSVANKMGLEARKKIMHEFEIKNMASKFISLYERCILAKKSTDFFCSTFVSN